MSTRLSNFLLSPTNRIIASNLPLFKGTATGAIINTAAGFSATNYGLIKASAGTLGPNDWATIYEHAAPGYCYFIALFNGSTGVKSTQLRVFVDDALVGEGVSVAINNQNNVITTSPKLTDIEPIGFYYNKLRLEAKSSIAADATCLFTVLNYGLKF